MSYRSSYLKNIIPHEMGTRNGNTHGKRVLCVRCHMDADTLGSELGKERETNIKTGADSDAAALGVHSHTSQTFRVTRRAVTLGLSFLR